ncbi:MAG: hypothetical protein L0L74_09405 [Corynebacterium casei]|uniref:hypothetical protein n=1 Tax=Corynebacterium sp. TaxID=1720 RepID=UPI00264711B9|nr:hypothetical protein [Corynebacterium sp.]MDN6138122.1 hypothetical protein [Corynebacterium sp.]MDN6740296.1 hypothetical protein [Corynebacterium casei]
MLAKTATSQRDIDKKLEIAQLTPSDIAGQSADGRSSDSFPSATALHYGDVGEQIVELCRAASERYSPDRIALTELMGDAFFSDVDEELFSDMTGEDGFPRTDDDDIDTSDETVQQWQSDIVTDLISRCRSAANTEVEMDARVNWAEPGADRADSGHRYDDLLDAADHVTLWAYTGLQEDSKPKDTAKLVDALRKRYSFKELDKFTVSVGLWSFPTARKAQSIPHRIPPKPPKQHGRALPQS